MRKSRKRDLSDTRFLYRERDLVTITRPERLLRGTELVRTLEDNRLYAPDRSVRRPMSVQIGQSKVVAKKFKKPWALNFARPRGVAICARRTIRKEVMFAKKFAGKRGVGRGKPRRTNFWSKIGC